MADQVAHLAHLNARDTTLAYVSRAPQADIERWKARMGWDIPWYTITDDFDADFGVDEWHGTNAFFRDDDDRVFRTYFINKRGDEALGSAWSLPRHHRARPPGGVGGLARGLPADAGVRVVEPPRRVRRGDRVRGGAGGRRRLAARREDALVIVAHVGGVPVEEILPTLAGTGTGLLVVRGWLTVRLRRRRRAREVRMSDGNVVATQSVSIRTRSRGYGVGVV